MLCLLRTRAFDGGQTSVNLFVLLDLVLRPPELRTRTRATKVRGGIARAGLDDGCRRTFALVVPLGRFGSAKDAKGKLAKK